MALTTDVIRKRRKFRLETRAASDHDLRFATQDWGYTWSNTNLLWQNTDNPPPPAQDADRALLEGNNRVGIFSDFSGLKPRSAGRFESVRSRSVRSQRTSTAISIACVTVGMLLLLSTTAALGIQATEPAKPRANLVLFYSDVKITAGQQCEFVVKVQNAKEQAINVHYDPLHTHVVDSVLDTTKPVGQWHLELLVEIESDVPAMDLSGRLDAQQVEVPPGSYKLVLLTPPHNRLPGTRLRIWAELKSPDGSEVYRSNQVVLRRDDQ